MGFDGAGGGLIEFRQLQRRQQAEAARALLLRDGDGGLVGFFGRGGVRGIAPKQDVATDAVQQGVDVSDVALTGQFDRQIDQSQRLVGGHPFGFEFCEPTVKHRCMDPSAVTDVCLAVAPELRQLVGAAASSLGPR